MLLSKCSVYNSKKFKSLKEQEEARGLLKNLTGVKITYSTPNEGKSVVAERCIRSLKKKTYKYMTSVSKTVYINKLDDIVNKYSSTYHSTIKIKPVDVKSNTYINSSNEINNKDPKLKLVILTEYQNIKIFLQKVILQIGQKKFF